MQNRMPTADTANGNMTAAQPASSRLESLPQGCSPPPCQPGQHPRQQPWCRCRRHPACATTAQQHGRQQRQRPDPVHTKHVSTREKVTLPGGMGPTCCLPGGKSQELVHLFPLSASLSCSPLSHQPSGRSPTSGWCWRSCS